MAAVTVGGDRRKKICGGSTQAAKCPSCASPLGTSERTRDARAGHGVGVGWGGLMQGGGLGDVA